MELRGTVGVCAICGVTLLVGHLCYLEIDGQEPRKTAATPAPIAEIRMARPQPKPVPGQKIVILSAPLRTELIRNEDHEDPLRFSGDLFKYSRQMTVATSSTSVGAEAKMDGIQLYFSQLPAEHGLPYTVVLFGSPDSQKSTST